MLEILILDHLNTPVELCWHRVGYYRHKQLCYTHRSMDLNSIDAFELLSLPHFPRLVPLLLSVWSRICLQRHH